MRKFVLFFTAICMFQISFAQNRNQEVDIVNHTVQLGETVRMLSKKYLVNPSDIYRINKFAVNGISQGMVLQIPVPRKEVPIQQEETQESPETAQTEVQSESQYQEPSVQNAPVKNNKSGTAKPITVIDRDSQTEHTVQAGETLYSLSRQYGVSVAEIKMSNEGTIGKGLKLGQVVKIPSTKTIDSTASSIGSTVTPTREVTPNKPVADAEAPKQPETAATNSTENGIINHKVAPKETLYSLSKRYNITVDDIKAENPDVERHGLQIGQTLIIRKN